MMEVVALILKILNYIFVGYTLLYTLFLATSAIVGSFRLYRAKKARFYNSYYRDEINIPISVIIPAYNEEVTIVDAINSLLKLDYKLYEIVVVDDGSKDNTSQVVIDAFKMSKINIPIRKVVKCQNDEYCYKTYAFRVPITLVRKVNGGSKADANNMGINACNYPYFICMDADSVLQKDSLKEIAIPVLEDSNTVAVGGSIRILNDTRIRDGELVEYHLPKNIVAAYQSMEYDRSFLMSRLFYDTIDGSLNVSGAFGLFKKDIVVQAGGYDPDAKGEDMDLIMHLHMYCRDNNIPYGVRYSANAVCWTQVPDTLGSLTKQRIRWHLGMKQNLGKYKKMALSPKYRSIGLVSIPAHFLFEMISPIVEIVGLISIIVSLSIGLGNIISMLILTAIFACFGFLISLISYVSRVYTLNLKISFKDFFYILGICFIEAFFMHEFLLGVRFASTFISSKKKRKWETNARKKID